MAYRVVFSPEARDQLAALFHYIADAASPVTAARYTSAVVDYCESLQSFPHRGTKRDDIRPGLRITHFRRRTIIAFSIHNDIVAILGLFHGGRNYEAILGSDLDETEEY